MNEPEFRTKSDKLITQLLEAKNLAGKLGLWVTFHAIDDATTKVGWEVAEALQKYT